MRCYLKGEWQNPDSSPFDLAGCVLYALAIAALVYGASISATRAGQVLLAAGLLCGVAFVLHQYKSRHPVLDLRLFTANRSFAFSSFAALFNYSATYAVTFTMSLYLQYIQAMTWPPARPPAGWSARHWAYTTAWHARRTWAWSRAPPTPATRRSD